VNFHNIGEKVSPLYKRGLEGLVLGETESKTLDSVDNWDLGKLLKELNRLSVKINQGELDINNFSKAVQTSINKILLEKNHSPQVSFPDKNMSPYEAVIEILSNPLVVEKLDEIIDKLSPSIFSRELYKPVMTSQLWDHQKDALRAWIDNKFQGYVDMATATGKTVLGLSTIATLYGKLHPEDSDFECKDGQKGVKILIAAHNKLILEQWRREFDYHLNIPPDISASKVDPLDTIDLKWGKINFATYNNFPFSTSNYDLVILDEVHRKPKILSRFKKQYDDFKNSYESTKKGAIKIIGLSGSIDVSERDRKTIRKTIEKYLGPSLKTYSLEQARKDNIIPEFNWRVIYTGYNKKPDKLEKSTRICKELFQKFEKEKYQDTTLRTFDDVRNFSQTKRGIELKEEDEDFEKLSSELFTRRSRIWNQIPNVEDIGKELIHHADSRKCLVLVKKKNQVKNLKKILVEEGNVDNGRIWTIVGDEEVKRQKNIIEDFDERGRPGVLIGTGNLLGIGIDIKNLEIVINMSRGKLVNKTLIQRMGRMLRSPSQKEEPTFYHFTPIPVRDGLMVPREDGKQVLKGASQYLALGSKIGAKPVFSVSDEKTEEKLITLERIGGEFIRELDQNGCYRWPQLGKSGAGKKDAKDYLKEMIGEPHPEMSSIILDRWGKDDREKTNIKSLQDIGLKFVAKVKSPLNWIK